MDGRTCGTALRTRPRGRSSDVSGMRVDSGVGGSGSVFGRRPGGGDRQGQKAESEIGLVFRWINNFLEKGK